MNYLKENWFSEIDGNRWSGQCFSMKCDEILYHKKSKFQDIMVIKNNLLGNVLILDGRVQCSDFDQFSYAEMMSFVPLNCHPNPENVLIIGGGDGGVAREVTKHPLVKRVTQCEIDEVIYDVINVTKKYLPEMAKGFESEKLKLHIGDGFEYLKNNKETFDIIITDSSDPIGPAECLFEESYYKLMSDSLKSDGIICCQGQTFWFYTDFLKKIFQFSKILFPSVAYSNTLIPTYPSGCSGFILCSKSKDTKFADPIHKFDSDTVNRLGLKYYNLEIHQASFALPTKFRKILKDN